MFIITCDRTVLKPKDYVINLLDFNESTDSYKNTVLANRRCISVHRSCVILCSFFSGNFCCN